LFPHAVGGPAHQGPVLQGPGRVKVRTLRVPLDRMYRVLTVFASAELLKVHLEIGNRFLVQIWCCCRCWWCWCWCWCWWWWWCWWEGVVVDVVDFVVKMSICVKISKHIQLIGESYIVEWNTISCICKSVYKVHLFYFVECI